MMLRSSAAQLKRGGRSSNLVIQLLLRPVATKNPERGFALFQSKNAQGDSQRNQEEIVKNIETYRNNIRSKTQQGYGLSRTISESVEQDKHLKLQRYEIFIDKMQRLYKSEVRFAKKQEAKLEQQRNAIVFSLTPLKEILKAYNELTQRGFNSEATVQTLKNVSAVIRGRGFKGRVHTDYSTSEMDHSWRMQKLIDDLKFGLRGDQFFSATHLAQSSMKLGDIGYKNTELIPLIFNKLNIMLDERQLGTKNEQNELNFNDAVYGGPKGFVDRHYVFKGFQNSKEFNEYLQILMEWEKDAVMTETTTTATTNLDNEAEDVQRSMADIINAAVQVKELQKEYQSSIDNLRQQYFKMSEATDKHTFLQENQYIKYDLLELQELLVKGGYMEPEEAASSFLSQEPFEQRMSRAADVFYEYVVNYAPELLSPQHNSFYETAINTDGTIKTKTFGASQVNYLAEQQNQLTLETLSQTLLGLSEQSLSFRRDVLRRDYLNKFYEDYLMPLENKVYNNSFIGVDKTEYENVMMERGYLRAWQQFKEQADRIAPRFAQLVKEDKDHIEGQLTALAALSASRLDQPALRSEIVSNALRLLNQTENLSASSVVQGLKGLAESASLDDKAKQLSQRLANRLDISSLSFPELVDSLWSMSALSLYDSRSYQQALNQLNEFKFERLDNDLKYEEYMKLLDIYNALRFDAPKNLSLQLTSSGLLSGFSTRDHLLSLNFASEDQATRYDPFKQRVVQAMSQGLNKASVEHQVISEGQMYENQTLDTDVLNTNKYPYKPDIVMGYRGQKVGVFVLPETQTTRDTLQANGTYRFRMRILEQAHENKIRTAAIAVPEVVSYDIEKLRLDLNSNFNLSSSLDSQLRLTGRSTQGPDFSLFSDFGARFIGNAVDFIDHLPADKDVQKMDSLVNRMYQVLQLKQSVALKFEASQRAAGYDELRFQLMKLSLLYDSLTKECKEFIDSQAKPASQDFKAVLQSTLNTIPKGSEEHFAQLDAGFDKSWMGTRQEVELPVQVGSSIRKSIVPEMINQRFMWVDDYFHYDDWRAKQKQVFDNFNLLTVPQEAEGAQKYFYDKDHHQRRIPQGVFPYPNHKRQLMLPATNNSVTQLLSSKNHDDFVLFEKEPYKMMVINELKKAETLAPIDEDTSMITNLQNIKQGLKSDYSDKEILNTIMVNMNFTDQLIEEHLKLKKADAKSQPRFVPRDAEKYRKFVESTYHSKDREDPYSHFFLTEAKNKELIKTWMAEEKQMQKEYEAESRDPALKIGGKQRRKQLQDKIEDLLLSEELNNQDLFDLSSSGLKSEVNVKYDMRTLIKSEFIYDMDPDLSNESGLTAEEYLQVSRRRAEAKLIKSKLIYKVNLGRALSNTEKAYMKHWVSDILQGGTTLLNLRDSMLPNEHTKLTIGDIDAKSLYALNSISRVQLERERHGTYSLNDLIVELSHFLDEEVVNKVETEMFGDKLRKEWGLSKDFKVVDTRNKEISLVLNEMEEMAWRSAGQLTQKEVGHVKDMLSIKRNKDYFDRQFYENDMKSLQAFAEAVNAYDDRLDKLERWVVRKEDEVQSRIVRPPKNLQKSDQELFAEIDAPLKRARERMTARLLIQDEYGNPIEKEYKDLTSRELHTLTENLSLRLYLFNYEYPAFVPQIIRAVREHPNILKSDRDQIELYCRMFEVDWRGDSTTENKEQFMSSNPIYLDGSNLNSVGEITSEVLKDKLQRACASFVEETASKIIQQASQ